MQDMQYDEQYLLAQKRQGTIGMSLCVFMVVWIAAACALGVCFPYFLPKEFLEKSIGTILVSDIAQYLIAIPIAMLIMRAVPTLASHEFPMSLRQFLGFYAVSVPVMYGGSLIGAILASFITDGKAENRISETIASGNMWETLVFVVILAPIVEEWFFRKQILSRLRAYGEKKAIVFSALAFALYHMNIFQFFYAFGLGLILGYMYVRTSKLRYSIFLHMIVNFQGSIVFLWMLKQMTDAKGNLIEVDKLSNEELMNLPYGFVLAGLFSIFVFAVFVVGIVLLVRNRRYLVFFDAPLELPKKDNLKSLYGTVGVITFLIISVILNVMMLFS